MHQVCGICGKVHSELPLELAYKRPLAYFQIPDSERAARVQISADFCVIDEERFYIRCYLTIPIQYGDEHLGLGVWVETDRANVLRYAELYDIDGSAEPPFLGRLSAALPWYNDIDGLPVDIQLRGAKDRPLLTLRPDSHPLIADQREGITLQRAHELLRVAFPGLFG